MLLALSRAQVVIVLVPLGVLMLVSEALVRTRTAWLGALAVPVAALAMTLPLVMPGLRTAEPPRPLLTQLVALMGGAGPYRLSAFTLYAIAGILLVRWLRGRPSPALTGLAGVGAAAVMGGLLIAPNLLGLWEVHAYDGTWSETLGDLAGATAVVLACWTATTLLPRTGGVGTALRVLATPGATALTAYCLQILVLHVHGIVTGGARDDSWGMLALLLVIGLGVPIVWAEITRRVTAPRSPWRRGPVEGVIELLVRPLRGRGNPPAASGVHLP
ncbi:hypothetical protein JSY14_01710 [Brachybacterium sp. EF45031]|uniref:hypothetical protein n=1 Tax=Brachybacterium sillae TaxID=2810536 RepID=UPI00217CF1C2|nr:hypothetical protein [Brachybacterium sillae]MCS6710798.1 hypothetical protein [Brachybacterium sillae]